jgi:hypothetical protein
MDTNNLVGEANPAPEDVRFLEDRLYIAWPTLAPGVSAQQSWTTRALCE